MGCRSLQVNFPLLVKFLKCMPNVGEVSGWRWRNSRDRPTHAPVTCCIAYTVERSRYVKLFKRSFSAVSIFRQASGYHMMHHLMVATLEIDAPPISRSKNGRLICRRIKCQERQWVSTSRSTPSWGLVPRVSCPIVGSRFNAAKITWW